MANGQVPGILSNLDGERFPEGLHICHIFNDDDERMRTLARFHASGQRAGEFGLMLSDAIARRDFLAALGEAGAPIPEDSQKVVSASAKQSYCPGEEFEPQKVLAGFGGVADGARSNGFSGLRISGEMGWAARNGTSTERLLEYEAAVKEAMVRWPSTAACEYDARLFSGATILDVLSVHPAMIVRGQILVNPYYVEPAVYLQRYRERHHTGH